MVWLIAQEDFIE